MFVSGKLILHHRFRVIALNIKVDLFYSKSLLQHMQQDFLVHLRNLNSERTNISKVRSLKCPFYTSCHPQRRYNSYVARGETDILLVTLSKARDVNHAFELINLHHSVMNNRHLSMTFDVIHDFVKHNQETTQLILVSPEFRLLCQRTLKAARFLNHRDTVNILKSLIMLRVPADLMIMQAILQMLREQINDLDVHQILLLDFLLNERYGKGEKEDSDVLFIDPEHKSTQNVVPLIEALKIALPLVLQIRIKGRELNLGNIALCLKCLRLAVARNLRPDVVNEILKACQENYRRMDLDSKLDMVYSFLKLKSEMKRRINLGLFESLLSEAIDEIREPENFERLAPKMTEDFLAALERLKN